MEERSRRASKAELEEDRFLEWVLQAGEYVRSRAQLFIGAAVALVAVIVIAHVVRGQRVEARSRASAMIFEANLAEQSGQLDQAVGIARQLIEEYPGTPAASHAVVLLANRYFTLGRYVDAQRLYQRYLDDHGDLPPLVYAARTGLAACLEAQGEIGAAARAYIGFADDHPGHPPSAMALMDGARCFRLLGEAAQERGALERVVRDYPETPVAQRARQQLELLPDGPWAR